ncbi:aminotransferase class I/II-fold pyridoxal phosphate-dependent enzyme [Natronorubrum sp. JWXQ-INN-674]|uniref:Aminotransferase class I/II-fold pyridoxal phosphate-dependent enzyme n=1 Tax=Natronorubrum halalkaliphilum TaxID=2691917 RepID=A0A6B0VIB1_9EURY|nr:pyridoxal phosphate-dependent aminotransferase [Natronorubrum halalkaliphilum]MXV60686.1 aminotransferase class I/II-fold pyridoxal phosphate-dependent enzyme [Natronorubrum halalkaliphilum]
MEYETPLFFHVMEYAKRADRDVVDMVSGTPDWEPPESLRDAVREYADLESDQFQYPPSEGLLELREEIAARRGVDAEQVVITNGAGEANYLAMARALERDRGSEVILTDPVYPYYPGKTTILGGTQRFVATDEDGQLDPAAVRAAASEETAVIVVNTPNNPTGAVYPEETIEALVDIAEEYDAILVSDEVYDHYDLSGEFASALQFESDHRIVTNAFSKSMAITGYRVGYAIFPPTLVENAKSRHMLVNVATTRPGQYAVLHALKETGPDYFEANRQLLRERVETFTDALDAADAEYTTPQGSFYVMARFDGYPGTLENVERLIDEAGVAGMPGEAFGDSRTDWIRFALVTPRAETAAERLAAYFD